MKDGAHHFLVGVFVLVGLTTLGVLMVWFGETPSWLQRSEWTLRISGVDEVRGIGDGSPVFLSGVEIGRVRRLEFENLERPDRGVLIITSIRNKYLVPSSSFAKIYGATLGIGRGQINIIAPREPTAPLPTQDQPMIFGEMANTFGELIPEGMISSFRETVEHIGDFAAASKPVADNLARLLEQRSASVVDRPGAAEEGLHATVATAIERIDRFFAHLNTVAGDEATQKNLKDVVSDLKSASGELAETAHLWKTESQRLSDNLNGGIDRTEQNLETLAVKLTSVAERLDKTADNLNVATAKVAEGRGTIGLLVNDPRLYESAVLSIERLGEFMATLNRIAGNAEREGYIPLEVKTAVGGVKTKLPLKEE